MYYNMTNKELLDAYNASAITAITVERWLQSVITTVGDCAGIFRRATETCTRRGRKDGDDEIIAYYHDGEF